MRGASAELADSFLGYFLEISLKTEVHNKAYAQTKQRDAYKNCF
jgi:hypothetical protein